VVSTDCAARRCSVQHALAGIAIATHALADITIATMTSLCHLPMTDSETYKAPLVRRALAEVCTVQVLLVYIRSTRQELITFRVLNTT